jgi:hypothetical protein
VIGFPLLIIPFAIYNMIAFITPMDWGTKLYSFHLMSGVDWSPTLGDAFLAFTLLMLLFEFAKSAKHGKSFIEHFLALLLAAGATAEFLKVTQAGNSVFVLLTVICFVDLLAGFAAAVRRRQRKVVVEQAPVVVAATPAPVMRAEPVRVEPVRVEPATRPEPAPFGTRQEPAPFAAHPEPVVKVDPSQKIEP